MDAVAGSAASTCRTHLTSKANIVSTSGFDFENASRVRPRHDAQYLERVGGIGREFGKLSRGNVQRG
jgi:hypothetical protein